MAAKKARKRAYIPPSSEVVNRRETTSRAKPSGGAGGRASGRTNARGEYVYPTPSLQRTAKRLPVYFVLIFALQYYLLGTGSKPVDGSDRLVFALGQAALVTVFFAPFMHVMDRVAYNRYLKRSGQAPAAKD